MDYKASAAAVNSNSLRLTTIPATRGVILDRGGHPLVTNVTTTEIRLSREEAALHPTIKGALSSLTGLSVLQINADLANVQYSPYQPAPVMINAPARDVEFIRLHPGEFPGVSILTPRDASTPTAATWQHRYSVISADYLAEIVATRGRPQRLHGR